MMAMALATASALMVVRMSGVSGPCASIFNTVWTVCDRTLITAASLSVEKGNIERKHGDSSDVLG